jgi:putative phosphoribosyl transferase
MSVFKNRKQAGTLLGHKIQDILKQQTKNISKQTVVLGLPRGGVPIALEVALILNCPMDILVAKKIGAPGQSELAVGAISSHGIIVIDESMKRYFNNLESHIEMEKERLLKETIYSEQNWLLKANITNRADLAQKNVIIIDDGIATGMTALAAIKTVKEWNASSIIVATPVMPMDTYNSLIKECGTVITLLIPENFHAVGNYYIDFHQVEDDEVVEALKQAFNRDMN